MATGRRIRVRRPLDYEYEPLREVTLTIRAFDGFCYSDDYVVRVIITDVNEPFTIQPVILHPSLFEGSFVSVACCPRSLHVSHLYFVLSCLSLRTVP